jgi:hypothetical protein
MKAVKFSALGTPIRKMSSRSLSGKFPVAQEKVSNPIPDVEKVTSKAELSEVIAFKETRVCALTHRAKGGRKGDASAANASTVFDSRVLHNAYVLYAAFDIYVREA